MKRLITALMTAALLYGCTSGRRTVAPVNPEASPEARQLLEFLYSIRGKYTLAGQHNFISDPRRYDSVVYSVTGKRPVVWGSDFSFNALGGNIADYHHCGPMNLTSPWGECRINGLSTETLRQNLVDEIKQRHAEGRIITLMWHCCFPSECNDCDGASIWTWQNRPSNEVWKELTTEGTRLKTQWKKQMDTVIPYLEQLRDAGIPILWRPYHEMNGVWFWWCNKPGENGFKKLWIMTYNYFTKVHKLNNLLWVWNTNAPRDKKGDEAGPYADFYPGPEYVDVLAADVYHRDYKQSHHDDLQALAGDKLLALGEVGQLPDPDSLPQSAQLVLVYGMGLFHQQPENRQPPVRDGRPADLRRSPNTDARRNRLLGRKIPSQIKQPRKRVPDRSGTLPATPRAKPSGGQPVAGSSGSHSRTARPQRFGGHAAEPPPEKNPASQGGAGNDIGNSDHSLTQKNGAVPLFGYSAVRERRTPDTALRSPNGSASVGEVSPSSVASIAIGFDRSTSPARIRFDRSFTT